MFVIHVKAGVYKESVEIPKKVNKIVLIGDGPLKTRITGRKNYAEGVKTFHTATVEIKLKVPCRLQLLMLTSSWRRTSELKTQPVPWDTKPWPYVSLAIVPSSTTSTLTAIRTLSTLTPTASTIATAPSRAPSTFIFGDAQALFQNCKFVVRKPGPNQACMVTAQGRVDRHSLGATVIQNGDFVAEPALLQASPPVKVYLGRPWKMLSRTIIMQSNIGGFVAPEGWSVWQGTFALDTLYYAEYQNRGPGSDQKSRVAWKGIQHFSPQMAESWTGAIMYHGDEWIRNSGVPYVPTMMKV
ncbi:UNVERIFIED_CONTAM: Pectinesterase [Sesamum angustifolium]|uniref:Pectinesterase n=1 Tax=Sesamum angustifolium TaxID=2727405 RepID=A0AAW2M0B2_9LAMI